VTTLLDQFSEADLRQLADLARLREQRRQNCLEALLRGPALGAFAAGAPPLPPTSPEELESAMCAGALRGWSGPGIARAAIGYTAGRLAPEIVARVVTDVLRRRKAGAL
jgi:hypothetical protein